MDTTTTNTSMHTWSSSGWTIDQSYFVGIVEIPPPSPDVGLVSEVEQTEFTLEETLGSTRVDDYEDLKEDLALALEAEEEYNIVGKEGTRPYADYRKNWLEPESAL